MAHSVQAEPAMLEQRRARERTVCQLQLVRQDPRNPLCQVSEWGSGFHYGGGWIVTTGGVAGVNGVNVPNLWVYLYAPTPENRGQVWRIFHPRPRLCIYLHVS